jgi:adenylosuccinate lyase
MIPRYSRPEMVKIWEPENRFRIWFEIEAHATDALAQLGVVPASAAQALWKYWETNPAIDVAAIDAIEAVTKHDVIAFLTWVAEQVGDEARFMHQGMTSSDVLDTTLSVQLARASDILLADLDALLTALRCPPPSRRQGWPSAHAELLQVFLPRWRRYQGSRLARR